MLGSIFGGALIIKGRRRAIFIMNGFIFVGAGISLILTVPTIIIGRFICGLAAGVLNMVTMKSIFETVPVQYAGVFGSLTNIFLNVGLLLTVILGMAIPNNPNEFATD